MTSVGHDDDGTCFQLTSGRAVNIQLSKIESTDAQSYDVHKSVILELF